MCQIKGQIQTLAENTLQLFSMFDILMLMGVSSQGAAMNIRGNPLQSFLFFMHLLAWVCNTKECLGTYRGDNLNICVLCLMH